MKAKEKTEFFFCELSNEAKETALENERCSEHFLDYEWWDGIEDGLKEKTVEEYGIDFDRIYFDIYRGTFSFSKPFISDEKKFIKWVGFEKEMVYTKLRFGDDVWIDFSLSDNYNDTWNNGEVSWDHNCDVFSDDDYKEIDDMCLDMTDRLDEALKDLCKECLKVISDDYDYLCSDEAIKENFECNEHTFDKEGNKVG